MFELVVLWSDGDKTVYHYETARAAEEARENLFLCFGDQIDYCEWRVRR